MQEKRFWNKKKKMKKRQSTELASLRSVTDKKKEDPKQTSSSLSHQRERERERERGMGYTVVKIKSQDETPTKM
jgi:hypothetical protein